jgi:Bacterial Ig domain/Fibronectin type III domain
MTHLFAALIAAALTASVQGQSSVTLGWDPDPGSAIVGYRLYDGVASRAYTNVIDTGTATTQAVSNLTVGVTYFFAVTAVGTNGLESDYSAEISYTVPLPTNIPPTISLTSPTNGSVYAAPAAINLAAAVTSNGHTISQVHFYNGTTLLGAVAAAPYSFSWSNVNIGTYSLSATAVYDAGSTVASAAVNVTVAAGRPPSGLTFAADSGAISAPFVATNGTVFQTVTTDVTNGGLAVYSFDVVNAGNYLVSAMINAPAEGENSIYVNIDAEPTDPLMIWDIPVTTGLTSRTVSWRGNGTSDPASAQYSPKVFTLSAGTHQLIIRGREANTILGTISIAATPPAIRISAAAGGSVALSVVGQPGQTYNVMSSQDFTAWTLIGTVTLDANGSGEFTDPAGSSLPSSYYRLQGQ